MNDKLYWNIWNAVINMNQRQRWYLFGTKYNHVIFTFKLIFAFFVWEYFNVNMNFLYRNRSKTDKQSKRKIEIFSYAMSLASLVNKEYTVLEKKKSMIGKTFLGEEKNILVDFDIKHLIELTKERRATNMKRKKSTKNWTPFI